MYCGVRPETVQDTTIIRPTTSLNRLPAASQVDFGDAPPWAIITTRTLVTSLGIDRGLFATWRCRGIGPDELPASWFRPASGRPCYYVASGVLAWLEARQGRTFDQHAYWLDFLRTKLGGDWVDLARVRSLAERQWLVTEPVCFTRTGLLAYLDYLNLPPEGTA